MLHITVGPQKPADTDDGLNRSHVGYSPDMTPEEAFEHNHGEWVIGARGRDGKERYALFSFEGRVIQAVEITEMQKTRTFPDDPKRDDKYTIDGTILKKGHPVFDKYVGEAQPVTPGRNPVRYHEDPEFDVAGGKLCRCGCGETAVKGDFIPGHDQKAIHERIARIGTVAEFLDWMDEVRPASAAA